MSSYQVDNIPLILKPFFYLYGYGLGLIYYFYFSLVRVTSKTTIKGLTNLNSSPNHIFCIWHHSYTLYVPLFPKHKNHVWMNHAAWYMKPVHVVLWLTGVKKLVLGSTGHAGKVAADRLVDHLRQGASTVVLPDGPAGPRMVLKKGTLHMSEQSGVPVVPIQLKAARYFTLNSWDKKRVPYPFNKLTAIFEKPTYVTKENFDAAYDEISKNLGT